MLVEVIEYHTSCNSPLLLVTLDATKAFDRVEYCKLFKLLIDRGICPLYAGFLIHMYTNQQLIVSWNSVFSDNLMFGMVSSKVEYCRHYYFVYILMCC